MRGRQGHCAYFDRATRIPAEYALNGCVQPGVLASCSHSDEVFLVIYEISIAFHQRLLVLDKVDDGGMIAVRGSIHGPKLLRL